MHYFGVLLLVSRVNGLDPLTVGMKTGARTLCSATSIRLLDGGVLYSVRNGGILSAFDAKTGELEKTGRIEGALGGYSASPVLAEGRIYFASEEGKVAVVRAGREWAVMQVNDLEEGMYATPALSEGKIFLRTAVAPYCFGGQWGGKRKVRTRDAGVAGDLAPKRWICVPTVRFGSGGGRRVRRAG